MRPSAIPECLQCGACCFGDGARYVPVTGDDHARLAERSQELTVFHGNRCYMRMLDGHCAALQIEAGRFVCGAYTTRPDACRNLTRGLGACQADFESKYDRGQLVQLNVPDAASREAARVGRARLPVGCG